MSPAGVWVQLLASLVALGAGVAALVIAIQLVHMVLGSRRCSPGRDIEAVK